jgi:two-component system, LytTR family, response regulator
MKKIKAIIVDDEDSARDVLHNLLLRFCPEVEILAKCENVLQAVEAINNTPPDLVFIDIEMPNYAGYEIVRFFDSISFEIIFVTAYDKYALRAFEIAAIDYLLKPVDIERLKKAVQRVSERKNLQHQTERLAVLHRSMESKEMKNIVITDKGQQHVIALDSIIAIEAMESYCSIHTTEKKYTVSKNLKHFENLLEETPQFLRVHKSWIINKVHIKKYSLSDLTIHMSNGLVSRLSKYKKGSFSV